ncbi:MAG: UbiA family prenyltransferase, partial [Paludibacteraceae bacterium]|nr:UbiA family prenyltransferase [Paludibacteraceae bacterium]
MSKILIWLKIIRPQTLFASICPVLVGLIITPYITTSYAIVTLLCAVSLQVLSNLINDYYDYVRGSDKKGRIGFSRALAEGIVSKKQMLSACVITLCISILTGLYLIMRGGLPIL